MENKKDDDIVFLTSADDAPQKTEEAPGTAPQGGVNPSPQKAPDAPQKTEEAQETSVPDLKYRHAKDVFKSILLGFFIGLAVIVPGVSGSTVAIIFKLYDKLLYALGNLFRRFKVCVLFLLPIALGLAIGFVLGFFAIRLLLEVSPFAVVGLFAGLMFGAFPAVYDEIRSQKRSPLRVALFFAGLAIPIAIALVSVFTSGGARTLDELTVWHYLLFVLLGYLVAVTQIVPGLSATALLMAVGYFDALMNSVELAFSSAAVFGVYACMVLGFALGLVTFSKLLTKLFARCRAAAFFVIVGLSLGSVVTMFFNPDIYPVYQGWVTQLNVLDLVLGIVLFIVGIVVAYLFVRYERRRNAPPADGAPSGQPPEAAS